MTTKRFDTVPGFQAANFSRTATSMFRYSDDHDRSQEKVKEIDAGLLRAVVGALLPEECPRLLAEIESYKTSCRDMTILTHLGCNWTDLLEEACATVLNKDGEQ